MNAFKNDLHDLVARHVAAAPALNGGRFGEAWVVYAYEVEGDRLAMHQARLAHRETAGQ